MRNMGKRLTPYQKVDNFITKCHDAEVDKWNAGLPNNADEWENFIEYWSLIDEIVPLIDEIVSLRKDNAELRMYNNKLNTEVEFKEKKYQELLKEYEKNIERVKILLSKEMLFKYLGLNVGSDVLDYANKYIDDILKGGK